MVTQTITAMLQLLRRRGIHDNLVLEAMANVPRDIFVAPGYHQAAYDDFALPLSHGQTISQPYMVALMSQALQLSPGDRVLEIGTGSGYQAAILAYMGMDVYSVERIEALYQQAKARLQSLGHAAHFRLADGYSGWPDYAPYRGIIVTCAPTHIPQQLIDQLDEGGHMVIPVGPSEDYQTLWDVTRQAGEVQRVNLGRVAFVPFLRQTDMTP